MAVSGELWPCANRRPSPGQFEHLTVWRTFPDGHYQPW